MGALPQRGDVVVFRWPGDRSQVWVKRVIGLPGDRIALHEGRVSINGVPVGIRPDDRCYSVAKLFFAYGLGNSLLFPFSVGATAVTVCFSMRFSRSSGGTAMSRTSTSASANRSA